MSRLKRLIVASTILALSSGDTLTASTAQQDDETALITAASQGRVDEVRTLLDQGIDVNARNEDGWTPLLFAALGGHAEVVALLLEWDADVNVSNKAGWTPLIAAALSGHTEIVGLGDSALTALIVAARYGYAEVVNALVDGGAEVNATTQNGVPALEAAASGGHPEVVTLLVERGADVNAKVKEGGRTLLMVAAAAGRTDVANLLLEHGADVNAKNSEGWTALMSAAAVGHSDVVNLLLEHGGEINEALPAPLTSRPDIKDRAEATEIAQRNYPSELLGSGIGGTVHVWLFVDTAGRVQNALVRQSSGLQELDSAAVRAAREFEFIPGRTDDGVVPVCVSFPINFFPPSEPGLKSPEFRDPTTVTEIILRHYPTHLRDAGIDGTAYVKVLVGTSGLVQDAKVIRSSGVEALDRAAVRAAREFLFTPARRGGLPVATWVTFPITFPGR
jgi:TonB family protein